MRIIRSCFICRHIIATLCILLFCFTFTPIKVVKAVEPTVIGSLALDTAKVVVDAAYKNNIIDFAKAAGYTASSNQLVATAGSTMAKGLTASVGSAIVAISFSAGLYSSYDQMGSTFKEQFSFSECLEYLWIKAFNNDDEVLLKFFETAFDPNNVQGLVDKTLAFRYDPLLTEAVCSSMADGFFVRTSTTKVPSTFMGVDIFDESKRYSTIVPDSYFEPSMIYSYAMTQIQETSWWSTSGFETQFYTANVPGVNKTTGIVDYGSLDMWGFAKGSTETREVICFIDLNTMMYNVCLYDLTFDYSTVTPGVTYPFPTAIKAPIVSLSTSGIYEGDSGLQHQNGPTLSTTSRDMDLFYKRYESDVFINSKQKTSDYIDNDDFIMGIPFMYLDANGEMQYLDVSLAYNDPTFKEFRPPLDIDALYNNNINNEYGKLSNLEPDLYIDTNGDPAPEGDTVKVSEPTTPPTPSIPIPEGSPMFPIYPDFGPTLGDMPDGIGGFSIFASFLAACLGAIPSEVVDVFFWIFIFLVAVSIIAVIL